jgi:hypothetical protein
MPLDPQGNYYAALPDEVWAPAGGTLGSIGSGSGAPTGSTSITTIYIDTSTTPGTIYTYSNGAWSASGGGGAQLLTYTSGSPATPPDPTKPAYAYDPNGFLPGLGWRVSDQTWN